MSILKNNSGRRRRRQRTRPSIEQSQQHQRHVTFPSSDDKSVGDDENLTCIVAIIEPLAEEERANLWYSPQELREQRANSSIEERSTTGDCAEGEIDSVSPCEDDDSAFSGSVNGSDRTTPKAPVTSSLHHKKLHDNFETDNDICLSQKLRRKEFMEMFLAQQWEQRQMGITDPKGLFQFSKACSKQSRLLALQQAKAIHAEQELLLESEQEFQVPDKAVSAKHDEAQRKELAQDLDEVLDLVRDFENHF